MSDEETKVTCDPFSQETVNLIDKLRRANESLATEKVGLELRNDNQAKTITALEADRDRLRAALEAVTKRLSMVGSLYAADAAALDKARAALSPDNTKE
jgi:hypothetical protein